MSLELAIAAAGKLRASLEAEVDAARAERTLLRQMDAPGLFARAAERGRFLAEVARRERELADALAAAASSLGLPEVTTASLEAASPAAGRRLSGALGDIAALAGALREVDALNADLARRALRCVRGYVDALAPAPTAYGRAGARPAAPSLLTVSSRG